jgi:hypothetical protein
MASTLTIRTPRVISGVLVRTFRPLWMEPNMYESKQTSNNFLFCAIFQVLTAAIMKMTAFSDIMPCSLIEVHRCFRDAYCLHHQVALMMEAVRSSDISIYFNEVAKQMLCYCPKFSLY